MGDEAWERIGWATTPEELGDATYEIGSEATTRLMSEGKLTPEQLQTFVSLCKPRWEVRKAAEEASGSDDDNDDKEQPE